MCDQNNYPNYQPGGLDPRAVTLIVTDWNAFFGAGKTTVPVVTFATFYITGWSDASSPVAPAAPIPPTNLLRRFLGTVPRRMCGVITSLT